MVTHYLEPIGYALWVAFGLRIEPRAATKLVRSHFRHVRNIRVRSGARGKGRL